MDQCVVRARQLVDLNFESKINPNVSGVVVILLFGIGESYEHAGVVVRRGHHPFEPQHVPSGRWAVEPQHAQIGARMSLERAAADEKPAWIVASRLVANCGHPPVAKSLPVEECFETRVSDKRRRCYDL